MGASTFVMSIEGCFATPEASFQNLAPPLPSNFSCQVKTSLIEIFLEAQVRLPTLRSPIYSPSQGLSSFMTIILWSDLVVIFICYQPRSSMSQGWFLVFLQVA